MKSFLFAALSLVSGLGKDQENESLHNLEIEKNSDQIIEGRYACVNNLCTLSVKDTLTEDYLYTFDAKEAKHVYRNKEEIHPEDLKDGDLLRITYDGTIALEYPPRLSNISKIEVVDEGTKK